jgi:hypothetical protein
MAEIIHSERSDCGEGPRECYNYSKTIDLAEDHSADAREETDCGMDLNIVKRKDRTKLMND